MPDENKTSRVLRIPLPMSAEQNKTCFIATPFDPRLDDVLACIERVVARIPFLQAVCTKHIRAHHDFYTDIVEGIRNATVVIAIINNNEEHDDIKGDNTGPCNPNVMYELGIAHALGKPVILVIDKRKVVPVDIQHLHWMTYHRDDNFDPPFFESQIDSRLRQELTTLRKRGESRLLWRDAIISETAEQETRLSLDELLTVFKQAFDFGKAIHEEFHALVSSQISPLSKPTSDLTTAIDDIAVMTDFRSTFELYKTYYDGPTTAFLKSLPAATDDARNALSSLMAASPDNILPHVRTLLERFNNVDLNIVVLPTLHERLCKAAKAAIFQANGRDHSKNVELYAHIKFLEKQCNSVVMQADSYLKTLINVFFRFYKGRPGGR